MSTRRLWLVPAFLLLLPGEVMAHRHRTGFYIPKSWLHHSESTSWGLSGETPIFGEDLGLSAIGAISRYSGKEEGKDFKLLVGALGLRYTFKLDSAKDDEDWSPFLHVIGGFVDHNQRRTRGVVAFGGGFNIRFWELGTRGHFTFYVQADVVRFEREWGFAQSAGFGFQFPHHKVYPKDPRPKDPVP
jgi:hypothetical protein